MAVDVAARIRSMKGVPDELKAALTEDMMSEDGSVDAAWLAQVFQRLDGEAWSQERVGQLIAAAGGGPDGRIRFDELLAWLFAASKSPEQDGAAGSMFPDEEPSSPKIGRKGRNKKGKPDPWDSWEPTGGVDQGEGEVGEEPCSPKIPGTQISVDPTSPHIAIPTNGVRRREIERRAQAYTPQDGERIYIPESHRDGVLLLRPDKSFAYVHTAEARFSEGVHGEWVEEEEGKATLAPSSFGWCYQESFDDDEIMGTRYTLVLLSEQADDAGRLLCALPDELITKFSWLDPTLPE